MNTHEIGSYYEDVAARYLSQKGLVILERNYRCPGGEIDLIAKDGPYLVFVEVKYRHGSGQGGTLAAVTREKQKRISRAAAFYLLRKMGSEEIPCRFDVVGVEKRKIRWISGAFESCYERKGY